VDGSAVVPDWITLTDDGFTFSTSDNADIVDHKSFNSVTGEYLPFEITLILTDQNPCDADEGKNIEKFYFNVYMIPRSIQP